tara:strand:+ start:1421 stop:2794 length:1374 start_codon:yes stop_codon:yes gene_type:complete
MALSESDAQLLEDVECMRSERSVGEPAPAPESFGDAYRPPAHRVKLLETRHGHARDERIHFLEAPHLYIVDGAPMETSVTSIVSAFAEAFDPDRIIALMASSRKETWPRKAYALNVQPVALPHAGRVLAVNPATEKTLWCGEVTPETTMERLLSEAAKKDRSVSSLELFSYERALTGDEIKLKWKRNGNEKANMGTEAHLLMELWSNSEPTRMEPELRNGLTFLRDHLKAHEITSFRTEWEVHATAEGFAGSIDWVGQFPDGSLIIVDWKRTASHEIYNGYRKFMREPLAHLDDVDCVKYVLQLSTYAYVLQKYYGFKVRALALCSIHPDHPFHFFAPYMRLEVEYLMAKRRERVALKTRLEFDGGADLPRCAASGDIAWVPVSHEGKTYDEKQALWRFPDVSEFEHDLEAAEAIRRAEASVVTPPSAEERALAHATPWRKRIPPGGVTEFRECHSF